ncbi:hypothetical protein K493DRAFT_351350 [Basidiobolus meristosporus CBS 931.73]|uniref:Uncharacterized protein n=1 Tax=Basidiobolus meristosporus CBS 931.73 TaxID=1314790 RepID=A0A1Y1YCG4_9FUNG|nr:hypothetical protein K493DRAFT_351350 [Basidiobolus meristosporus CBS 931.73]|eukprot:ORX95720.1 hypothetical protein K493DRAFT_351350 [Basidiobolus meristosporus CBS 931.73]
MVIIVEGKAKRNSQYSDATKLQISRETRRNTKKIKGITAGAATWPFKQLPEDAEEPHH